MRLLGDGSSNCSRKNQRNQMFPEDRRSSYARERNPTHCPLTHCRSAAVVAAIMPSIGRVENHNNALQLRWVLGDFCVAFFQ